MAPITLSTTFSIDKCIFGDIFDVYSDEFVIIDERFPNIQAVIDFINADAGFPDSSEMSGNCDRSEGTDPHWVGTVTHIGIAYYVITMNP